jgi:hypothetical protein
LYEVALRQAYLLLTLDSAVAKENAAAVIGQLDCDAVKEMVALRS